MATEKQISKFSTIQRALGIIEGVMLLSDDRIQLALGTAVEMIDEALKGVLDDGNQAQETH